MSIVDIYLLLKYWVEVASSPSVVKNFNLIAVWSVIFCISKLWPSSFHHPGETSSLHPICQTLLEFWTFHWDPLIILNFCGICWVIPLSPYMRLLSSQESVWWTFVALPLYKAYPFIGKAAHNILKWGLTKALITVTRHPLLLCSKCLAIKTITQLLPH